MTIDITPEAIELLVRRMTVTGYAINLRPTLSALSAALTEQQTDAFDRGFSAGQAALKNAGEFVVIDSPELAELRAALTASQAETAAAYEAAAVIVDGFHEGYMQGRGRDPSKYASVYSQLSRSIRALTPADNKAALDRLIAEAWADGMRESVALCAVVRDIAKNMNIPQMALGASQCIDDILAAIPKGGE